jgi:hypothetical protein
MEVSFGAESARAWSSVTTRVYWPRAKRTHARLYLASPLVGFITMASSRAAKASCSRTRLTVRRAPPPRRGSHAERGKEGKEEEEKRERCLRPVAGVEHHADVALEDGARVVDGQGLAEVVLSQLVALLAIENQPCVCVCVWCVLLGCVWCVLLG